MKNHFYIVLTTGDTTKNVEYVYDCKNISNKEIYEILMLVAAKHLEKMERKDDKESD